MFAVLTMTICQRHGLRAALNAARVLRQVACHGRCFNPKLPRQITRAFNSESGHQFRRGSALELNKHPWLAAAATGLSAGLGILCYTSSEQARCKPAETAAELPEYDREEVARHNSLKDGGRVWVTYKDGVYDITEFVANHPGGMSRIMMAAGGAIDPFWGMYQQHNTQQVREILEEHRIGRLKGGVDPGLKDLDPYRNEPKDRHPALEIRSAKPMNAETPPEVLVGSLVTPTDLFYIRNHLPVPTDVDEKTYRLRVEGEGLRSLELSLEDLKRNFRKHTVTATIQCAGNRRNQLNEVKHVKGLEWEMGAIGTSVWAGARLRDVLRAAGIREDDPEIKHIQFEGLDTDMAKSPYGASIPVDTALGLHGDVILAYEMNGEPLTPDHGYPLRVVVPGVSGCRNVKWLSKIVASGEESKSFWQQNDYKSFAPGVDWENVDWDDAPPIYSMPVSSVICDPAPGTVVDDDEVTVRGYAYSGGGQGIVRVDVSVDEGKTWQTAQLKRVPQRPGRSWAWTLWETTIHLPEDLPNGSIKLCCKATDESYNTQPENAAGVWNLRGVVCNSWHSVQVEVQR